MATYNPPTQDLVIFDNSVFTDSNPSGNLTRAQADLLYLHFPFGQGAETIPSVSITGTSTLSGTVSANNNLILGGTNGVNYLEFPNGTKQYVAAIDYLSSNNLWSGKNQFNGDVSLNQAVTLNGASLSISSVPSTSDADNILVYDIASNQVRYEPSGNLITASNNKLLSSNNLWSGKNQFNADVSLNQAITLNGASLNIPSLTSASKPNQIYYDTSTNQISYSPIPSSASNTFYVATNGNDTTGVGSINAPYLTIQKAIDQCTSITAYYSIYIAAGSYTEALTIAGTTITGSPRISLIGATNTSNSKGVNINGSLSITLTTATGNEANNIIACNNLVITNSAANAVNVSGQGFSLLFTNCNLITSSTSSTLTLSSSATSTRYYFDRTNVSNSALTSTNPLVYVSRGAIWAITGCDFTNLNTAGNVITVTTNNALLLNVSSSVLTNSQAGVLVDCSSTLSAGNCGFSNSTFTAYASVSSSMFLLGNAGGLGTGGGYSFLNNTMVNVNATYATNSYISLRGGVQLQCDNNIFYNTKTTATAFTPFNSLSGTNNVFRYNNNVYINNNTAATNTVTYPTVNGTSVIISDNILSDVNYTRRMLADISLNGAVTLATDIWATSLASTADANAVSYNTTTKKLGYVALPSAPSTLLASNNTWSGENTWNNQTVWNNPCLFNTGQIYMNLTDASNTTDVVIKEPTGYIKKTSSLSIAQKLLPESNTFTGASNIFNNSVGIGVAPTVSLDVYNSSTAASVTVCKLISAANPTGSSETVLDVNKGDGFGARIYGIINQLVGSEAQFACVNGSSVSNYIACRSYITSGGYFYVSTLGTGTVYSNAGWVSNTNPSDPTMKKNITSLNDNSNNICDIVSQLNPISFEWIDASMGTGTKYGFSARQISELIPDITSTFNDASGNIKYSYDPVSLIPFLTSALQTKSSKIDELENKITHLENKSSKIDELENKISQLENKSSKIDELENKNSQLENKSSKIDELENKNSQLEQQLAELKNKYDLLEDNVALLLSKM